jgi:peroxiredoxin/predicted 2-oxoglutarate/Fe(II)-dependent dioxygenase YbiX
MGKISLGEPAPSFFAEATNNPRFAFHSTGGRYVVLSFIGSAGQPIGGKVAADWAKVAPEFDSSRIAVFAVSSDPEDRAQKRIEECHAFLAFWDLDNEIAKLYGMLGTADDGRGKVYTCRSVICDHLLRVLAVVPMGDGKGHVQRVMNFLKRQPAWGGKAERLSHWAPVLQVPRILEPELCQRLIDYYETGQPTDSGFMREVDGRTVSRLDHKFKRRSDVQIADEELRDACRLRIARRLAPEIERAFQFKVTHIERYIVACYEADGGGYFKPHRDNTTKGTAHRRFAVTINLNAEGYEGGDLRFPEYGHQTYRAPTGGAVVFSCSLLHEAMPITKGRRYCTLPFLYDEAGAAIRSENARYLGEAPPEPGERTEKPGEEDAPLPAADGKETSRPRP